MVNRLEKLQQFKCAQSDQLTMKVGIQEQLFILTDTPDSLERDPADLPVPGVEGVCGH